MEISLEQIERLLSEQKRLTVERLLSNTYVYNTETTDGNYVSLTIDKDKFMKTGMEATVPNDITILKSYGVK